MGVAGRIWQQEMIAMDNDRRNNALMRNALVKEQGLARRQRETKEFEMLGKIFESFTKTMDEASTPAMKTIMRERLSGVLVDIGKRSPFMFQALRARYPRDFRKLKTDAWLATNPPPTRQFQGENPSDNYTAFASDLINQKKFHRRMAKAIDGEEIDISGFHQFDEKMGMIVEDNSGKFQIVNMEMMNADPKIKDLLKTKNLSLYELQARNGNYDDSTVKVQGVGADGAVYEDLLQVSKNAYTGKMSTSSLYTTKSPKKVVHGESPEPDMKARVLITSLAAGVAPKPIGDDNSLVVAYNDIKSLGEFYYEAAKGKSPEEANKIQRLYLHQVERKFQQFAPEHVLVVNEAPEGGKTVEQTGSLWWKKFRIGKNAALKPIYGKREYARTADGKPFQLILDRANNIAYYPWGEVVEGNTVDAGLALAASMSAAQWQQWLEARKKGIQ